MLSRRYLQSHLLPCIVAFTFLLCSVLSVGAAEENDVILSSPPSTSQQNETDSSGNDSQGSETGTTISNEADTSTETTATPALSAFLFPETTDFPESSSTEKSTVTILPSPISLPSMIITATKVTLGHRMLAPTAESNTDSNEGSTETPTAAAATEDEEETSTGVPPSYQVSSEIFSETPTVSTSSSTPEEEPFAQQSSRQSRYHRFHEGYAPISGEDETPQQMEHPDYHSRLGLHETSTEFYKELEVDGGDSYADFGEDNDIASEHLPTPMALINPNGEGNNPPLEDDFAEAFKKVNSNGKRRRFRGGRRGRMKLKKLNNTLDNNASGSSTVIEHDENGSKASSGDWSTTESPASFSPKFKRYRSTTPNSLFVRSTTSTTTSSSVSSEVQSNNNDGGGPIVKNGPKPMILQNINNNYDDSQIGVTPVPQLEKPGNGGHTEKISTYFFSTPSPSARLRLRQKIRENNPPSSSTTTTTTTTTTTEAPTEGPPAEFSSPDSNVWNKEFSDFPHNQFFHEVTKTKFKIPEFVPIDLGIESDKPEPIVENSLTRPDPVQDKAYSVGHHLHSSGSYDSDYPSSSSSTTPKSHKSRRPTSESYSKHRGYDTTKSHVSPTVSEAEKPIGTEFYGSNTEASTTFASTSAHRTTPGGSHYDRTKDKVIFFNDSPLSTQHTSTVGLTDMAPPETTPGITSQTLGGSLSVSEGPGYYDSPLSPMVTVDHHYPPVSDPMSIFARGQVYPEEAVPTLESTFHNGPPDSSHIHSPNLVEHHDTQPPLPSPVPSDSNDDLQHHHHPPPQHSNHQGAYSQNYIEEPPPLSHHHQPMDRPAGGDSVYGTVEEVPAHTNSPYEYHAPRHHYPHQSMHPHPPAPVPYPFGGENPPQHAPSMPYPPPHSYPLPPPPPLPSHHHHHGQHGLPTHPMPPPHPLPQPPSLHHPQNPHAHHHQYRHPHHHDGIHNSFAQSYDIHPNNNDITNNQLDSHLTSNHIADSPSENSHPHHGLNPNLAPPHIDHNMQHQSDGHSSGTSSSPTSSSPPDYPSNSLSNSAPSEHVADGSAAPPPPPSHMDSNFPPHSHTMATHPDYEPANPPLPHDHPFHNSFIPFPPQDLQQQQHEQQHLPGHDTNSLAASGSGAYHPGIVETVPTGRPNSFEPSPMIPSKFTPIPDDVKETDLYSSFASKPQDSPSAHEHPHGAHDGSLSINQIPDSHQSIQHHHHHPSDQVTSYLGPTGVDHSSYHNHPLSSGPSASDQGSSDNNGYSGPVNEIHSGTYHPPNTVDITEHGDSYSSHHHNPYDSHDHSSPSTGAGYGNIHGGEAGPDYKPGDLTGLEKPHHDEHDDSHHLGPHDIKSNGILGTEASDATKDKKRQQASFSNTPYVLMFPQLIPEDKMRPSPPSLLTKEIPVIQASSMSDYTSSGEKPPLGPGFQAVPVHPRHQMYQVLAKTHYEKMMERYRESKKKPPSAIYTPYGILVPVGTNVDAAGSMNHDVFTKPRLPPKFRGEKSLLNTLLGSSSTNNGRFHPPVMGNRLTKMFEYEPAIDMLAEKLAMKIVNAQHALGQKKVDRVEMSGKSEGMEGFLDKTRNPDKKDHMTMESKIHAVMANPDLKDYLKGVLKGHITEMVETSAVSVEDRRPVTLSSKLLNSFFRKSRLGMTQPHKSAPSPILMQASASMIMPNRVPPPPGLQSQPSPHRHSGIGHPFPPPLPQGPPGGLLGTIKRLFNFAPPAESRYEIGLPPNFAGRTLYTNNGTHLPYIDGPSPRSSHFPPQIILPHPNMIHQFPPGQQHTMQSRISNPGAPPSLLSPKPSNPESPTPKPSKKKRTKPSSSSSSSSTLKKQTVPTNNSKWQTNNGRLPSSSSSSPKITNILGNSQVNSGTTTTTAKPNTILNNNSGSYYNHRGSSSSTNNNTSTFNKPVISKKTGSPVSSSSATSFTNNKSVSMTKGKVVDSHYSSSSTKQTTEIVLNKRLGIKPSVPISVSSSSDKKEPSSSKPLDMFQTILGSTRSVLNYFKAAEARKSSGVGTPTVLSPRSASSGTVQVVEEEESKTRRKRGSHFHSRT